MKCVAKTVYGRFDYFVTLHFRAILSKELRFTATQSRKIESWCTVSDERLLGSMRSAPRCYGSLLQRHVSNIICFGFTDTLPRRMVGSWCTYHQSRVSLG